MSKIKTKGNSNWIEIAGWDVWAAKDILAKKKLSFDEVIIKGHSSIFYFETEADYKKAFTAFNKKSLTIY